LFCIVTKIKSKFAAIPGIPATFNNTAGIINAELVPASLY